MLYKKKKWMALIFILPFVFFAAVFLIYPFVMNCINGFYRFADRNQTVSSGATFVAFENFKDLFTDPAFPYAVGNTFILIAAVIVFQMGLALVLALMVDRIKKFSGFFRVVYFIPIVLSGAVIGSMFMMFSGGAGGSGGVFNQLLAAFGIKHGAWVNDSDWFGSLVYLMVPVVWQYVGFYFVILLTGLTNISGDIMEAAALDGASTMQQIRYVTLPMLQNVFRTCMVLAITGALKVYDVPFIMAQGATYKTFFMGTYIQYLYNNAGSAIHPGSVRMGESSVFSIVLILTGVVVSQVSNLVLKENKDI